MNNRKKKEKKQLEVKRKMEERMMTNEYLEALSFNHSSHQEQDTERFLFNLIEWNISGLKREISQNNFEIEAFNPYYFSNSARMVKVNPDYAMTLTREDPGIAVEIVPERYLLVDGYHRLYRDIMKRKKEFIVYKIPFEIQVQYVAYEDMFNEILQMAKKKIC